VLGVFVVVVLVRVTVVLVVLVRREVFALIAFVVARHTLVMAQVVSVVFELPAMPLDVSTTTMLTIRCPVPHGCVAPGEDHGTNGYPRSHPCLCHDHLAITPAQITETDPETSANVTIPYIAAM
jgi:hypothetical protein